MLFPISPTLPIMVSDMGLSLSLAASPIAVPAWFVSVLLGVVMFGMGLATTLEDFKVVLARPIDIFVGCAAQFTIMPGLAWGLSRLFGLDDALTVGVVLVGCCPGGTASNVVTYMAKGDLALSVGMTAMSTMLAPFLTPILTLLLAGQSVDVDALGMFVGILWVVLLPIVLGIVAKRLFPALTERVVRFMPMVSSVAIAVIIGIVLLANADRLASGGISVVLVVLLHNLLGLLLGYMLATALRLSGPKRKALCIEVGMQNSGLAASLAAAHFAAYPMAAVPGAIFSVWHNISGALVARLFASRGPRCGS
ncbi:MAG: bile acid:sodium symporter family protein [Kiritimatiellae bacterium]|nr:bile acid:sodium symporter family protein [Kiritimatiellia bacterium]